MKVLCGRGGKGLFLSALLAVSWACGVHAQVEASVRERIAHSVSSTLETAASGFRERSEAALRAVGSLPSHTLHPDLSVHSDPATSLLRSEESRLAFDEYLDCLVAGTATAEQHAEWDWLDQKISEANQGVSEALRNARRASDGLRVDLERHAETVRRNAERLAGDFTGAVTSTIDAASASLDTLVTRTNAAIDSLAGLDLAGLVLREMGSAVDALWSGRENRLALREFLKSLLYGMFNGCFLGLMDAMAKSFYQWLGEDSSAEAIIRRVWGSIKGAGQEVVRMFKGILTRRDRNGMSRLSWIEMSAKSATAKLGEALVNMWDFLQAPETKEFLKPILVSLILGVIFTLLLLAFPGTGWIVKCAAVIMTGILSIQFLLRRTFPRFRAAWRKCGMHCEVDDAKIQVESIGEVIGFILGILLIVSPADLARIPNLAKNFNRNAISRHMRLTFTPDFAGSLRGIAEMKTLAMSGAGNKLSVLKKIILHGPVTETMTNVNLASRTSFRAFRLVQERTIKDARGAEVGNIMVDDVVDPAKHEEIERTLRMGLYAPVRKDNLNNANLEMMEEFRRSMLPPGTTPPPLNFDPTSITNREGKRK